MIEQIAKQRAEEARAAREKRLADAEELRNQQRKEAAEKKRQELERKSQLLSQASAVATTAATAADAVGAAVAAIRNVNQTTPFPASIPAVLIALASVAAAVASAKKLGGTIKGAEGGLIEGPSHQLGGIRGTGRFANVEVGVALVTGQRITVRA